MGTYWGIIAYIRAIGGIFSGALLGRLQDPFSISYSIFIPSISISFPRSLSPPLSLGFEVIDGFSPELLLSQSIVEDLRPDSSMPMENEEENLQGGGIVGQSSTGTSSLKKMRMVKKEHIV
ncbi:unnamed protein product [Thlaspi arvense]|uniref:Uncharacterized protein n=1 Tax=Thlaspi arvense TaxID=13288 RepID=A0AAU9S0B4_THLAR|nr:unnamed protein product [Thlaspi arvense]